MGDFLCLWVLGAEFGSVGDRLGKRTRLLSGVGLFALQCSYTVDISRGILHCEIKLTRQFSIIGPASVVCAETLRQNNYRGRIIMVTKDDVLPFDKPKLGKVRLEATFHMDFSILYCVVKSK